MRGLSLPMPQQLALDLDEGERPLPAIWASLPATTQEEALRILARAIARILATREDER